MRKGVEDLLSRIDTATEQHQTFRDEHEKMVKLWKIPTTADFLNLEFPPIQYLVGDWAAEGAPVLISGPTKCGKSLFVYSLLHAISVGESFLGWSTPTGGVPVAIVDGEMRPQTIKKRLQSITKHSGSLGNLKIVTREFFSERGLAFPDLSKKEDREILLTEISPAKDPVRLIVFDNINCIFKGDENQPGYWNQIEDLIKACRQRKIAVWLIHHNPKSRPDAPAGSSKAERFPEIVIVLEKIGTVAGQAAHFNIKFRHIRDLSETATDCSAHFDSEAGWEVGEYVPSEEYGQTNTPNRKSPERLKAEEEALRLATSGVPYRIIQSQTGIPISRISTLMSNKP
jgi:hypothetical protein